MMATTVSSVTFIRPLHIHLCIIVIKLSEDYSTITPYEVSWINIFK